MAIQHGTRGNLVVATPALAGQPIADLLYFRGHGLREENGGQKQKDQEDQLEESP